MRTILDLSTLAANLLVPLVLIAWAAFHRSGSRLESVLVATAAGFYLLFVWRAGPIWSWVGSYWPSVFTVLYCVALAALALRARDVPWLPPPGPRAWVNIAVLAVVAFALAVQIALVLRARSVAESAVDLAFPLQSGRFAVIHGGRGGLVNQHWGASAQRYALDIVALNSWGARASGLRPTALDRYAIFDIPVHAPCDAEVVGARDGIADDVMPDFDPGVAAGNYVALFCEGRTVLLAHLRASSVAVAAGDRVQEGQVVGRAGSSGNSLEPHLHIHAVAGRVTDPVALITSATAVPMHFAGRFLVRNDIVEP